jgi:hypothetical protein
MAAAHRKMTRVIETGKGIGEDSRYRQDPARIDSFLSKKTIR